MGAGGAVTASADNGTWRALLDPNRTFYNNWRLICLNAWIFLFLITSSSNGFDGSMMNGLQSLKQWEDDFNHPIGSTLGILNAIQSIGGLVALPFAPYLSDGVGRRPTVMLGAAILLGGTAIQTASTSVAMFVGARLLVGLGTAIAANAAPMLITELAYPPHRAPLTSLYNCMWYTGAISAAWTTFGCVNLSNSWAWRLPSLVQGVPSAAQVCLLFFSPESPRWLYRKGRKDESLKTLAYYHADGNSEDPLVQYEYKEIESAISSDDNSQEEGWASLFTTPGHIRRLRLILPLAFFSQWSGNGLVSYYLNEVFTSIGITDPTTQLLINGILQIFNLFVSVGAAMMVDKLGRRLLFLTSCAGMLAFFTMQTVCSAVFANTKSEAAAHGVIASIFLFFAAYDIAFTPLIVSYTVEILPFSVRAKGLTLYSLAVTIALVFNQYVNPVALAALGWKYYIVYCGWILFELVYCFMFIVETKGLSLEETAALFDEHDIPKAASFGSPTMDEEFGDAVLVSIPSQSTTHGIETKSVHSFSTGNATLRPGDVDDHYKSFKVAE